MKVIINKCRPIGEIICPPSKSYAHRYLIGAGLSSSKVDNIAFSNDIFATLSCLSSLGFKKIVNFNSVSFDGFKEKDEEFSCLESGSTLRFFIPLVLALQDKAIFKCSPRLVQRGVDVYIEAFKNKGIEINCLEDKIICKGRLIPSTYKVRGDVSSQYITGLLFALPLLDGDSVIEITSPLESKAYIDITIDVLNKYGIKFDFRDNFIYVKGNQKYQHYDAVVEGDYSNSAFLDAFNYLGGKVDVKGLNPSSYQGDKVYKDYFNQLAVSKPTLDISNCIDLGPVLFVFASLFNGGKFIGTKRLKIKESDRGEAIKQELEKIGGKIEIKDDEIEVHPLNSYPLKGDFDSHNDHRIAMALSLLSSKMEVSISSCECIEKSFPNYYDVLIQLGAKVSYQENE